MRKRIVPFARAFRHGAHGRDVLAVKRALARAGYGKTTGQTPVFGPLAVRNLKRFQMRHGLKPTGVYSRATHARLGPFFDDYAIWILTGAKPAPKVDPRRTRAVAAMTLLYNNRDLVHYTQGGFRMEGVVRKMRPPAFPTFADCSSAVTWAYFAAGADDPNEVGYNGTGYTGTLSRNGTVVDLEHARPGDLVFYGPGWPWQHVAMYVGNGRVLSHGSEPGPYLLPIDYRSDRGEIRSYLP